MVGPVDIVIIVYTSFAIKWVLQSEARLFRIPCQLIRHLLSSSWCSRQWCWKGTQDKNGKYLRVGVNFSKGKSLPRLPTETPSNNLATERLTTDLKE